MIVQKKRLSTPFASAARAAGASQASTSVDCNEYGKASAFLDITAVSGTPDSFTLDVKLQGSPDAASTADADARWFDITNGAFAQKSAVSKTSLMSVDVAGYQKIRAMYTLAITGGTAPKVTFRTDLARAQ